MDQSEMLRWGNLLDASGKTIQKYYTSKEMKQKWLAEGDVPPCILPPNLGSELKSKSQQITPEKVELIAHMLKEKGMKGSPTIGQTIFRRLYMMELYRTMKGQKKGQEEKNEGGSKQGTENGKTYYISVDERELEKMNEEVAEQARKDLELLDSIRKKIAKNAWLNAPCIPGRDEKRWRFDVFGRPVLQPMLVKNPLRAIEGMAQDEEEEEEEEPHGLFSYTISNGQLMHPDLVVAKYLNKDLSIHELMDYHFDIKPTRGLMDVMEMTEFGDIKDDSGRIVQKIYSVKEMRKRTLLKGSSLHT